MPTLLRFCVPILKQITTLFILLIVASGSLSLLQNRISDQKASDVIEGLLKGVNVNAENSGNQNNFNRYYNPNNPFSIFVSCIYTDPNNPMASKAVFGYSNRTTTTINLDQSKLPESHQIWLNDANKYPKFPFDLPNETKKDNSKNKNKPVTSLVPGEVERAFAVEVQGADDVIWSVKIDKKNPAAKFNTLISQNGLELKARANVLFTPPCDQSGKSPFQSGYLSGVGPLPMSKVNSYVVCSEFNDSPKKNGKPESKPSTFSTQLGYRNESGSRIDLTNSLITNIDLNDEFIQKIYVAYLRSSNKEKLIDLAINSGQKLENKQVVQSYFNLSGQNLVNLGLLKNIEYKDSTDPVLKAKYQSSFQNAELDYTKENILSKLSGAIQYLKSGEDKTAMIVQGQSGKDTIWGYRIKYQNGQGQTVSDYRLVRSNPEYDEPCQKPAITVPTDSNPTKKQDPTNPNESTPIPQVLSRPVPQLNTGKKDDDKKSDNNKQNSNPILQIAKSVLSLGSVNTNAQTADGVQILGGLNLDAYCKQKYGQQSTYELIGNDAYSWRCKGGGIDFNEACRVQYADKYSSGVFATRKADGNGGYLNTPYDWICGVDNNQLSAELGGIDLDGYCRYKYGSQAHAVVVGPTAYDWNCNTIPLDLNEACRMQYNSSASAYTSNPGDTNSIVCVLGTGNISGGGTGGGNGSTEIEPFIQPELSLGIPSKDEVQGTNYEININSEDRDAISILSNLFSSTQRQYETEVTNLLQSQCQNLDLSCYGKYAQGNANQVLLLAKFLYGMLKGVIDGLNSYIDFIKAITTQLKDTISGAINVIMMVFSKPKVVLNFILDKIDEFNSKSIYDKYEFFGHIAGFFVPDAVISAFSGSLTTALANIGGKISKILLAFNEFVETFKGVINMADKFIGRSIEISSGVFLPIVSVAGKTSAVGKDLYNIAKSASDDVWARLRKWIPDLEKLGKLETLRKFARLACFGYSVVIGAIVLTSAIPSDLIPDAPKAAGGIGPNQSYHISSQDIAKVDPDLATKYPSGVDVPYNSKRYPMFDKIPNEKVVQVDGLIGDYVSDFSKADKAAGIDSTYRRINKLTWHHVEDGRTMILIKSGFHKNAFHYGGASILPDYLKSIKDIC